jgi:hypothetical protein
VASGRVAVLRGELNLMSYALKQRLGVGDEGELVALDEEAHADLMRLSELLAGLVGARVTSALEERSRYTWEAFIGHCLRWWFGSGARTPLLKALQERLADHAIELELPWAEGSTARPVFLPPSQVPLWVGGVAGLAVSELVGPALWWAPWPITVGLGLAVGWSMMSGEWRCSSYGCEAKLTPRSSTCPSCGATLSIEVGRDE